MTEPLRPGRIEVALHGPNASIDGVIAAGQAMSDLIAEVGRVMGVEGLDCKIVAVQFKCDGCGATRPDRPGPDEGWTYSDGDDFCPSCTGLGGVA